VKDINQLLKEIIPPPDYQHRNGFSNERIVLSLCEDEKREIEYKLIEMLKKSDDTLIGETLAIMKSTDSLPILKDRLELTKKPYLRIMWANYINQIKGGDDEMKDIALKEFEYVTEKYSLIQTFYYLSYFSDSRINEKIRTYINHKDYLTAYNARTSLGIDTKEIIERERRKDKLIWWKFWKN
jgi:hypothetical protein